MLIKNGLFTCLCYCRSGIFLEENYEEIMIGIDVTPIILTAFVLII